MKCPSTSRELQTSVMSRGKVIEQAQGGEEGNTETDSESHSWECSCCAMDKTKKKIKTNGQ